MLSCIFLLSLIPSLASAAFFPKKLTAGEIEASRALLQAPAEAVEHGGIFHRDLLEQCSADYVSSCVLGSLFSEDVDLYSSCGGLFKENDQWCYDPTNGDVCCAVDLSDCCDPKPGAMFGVSLAVFVALSASILGCCYCCKCCCCYEKLRGNQQKAEATVVGNSANTTAQSPPVYASTGTTTKDTEAQHTVAVPAAAY